MHRVGFKPTIPVFERAKTNHALYRAATDRRGLSDRGEIALILKYLEL
jgi:hypothetical protein